MQIKWMKLIVFWSKWMKWMMLGTIRDLDPVTLPSLVPIESGLTDAAVLATWEELEINARAS